MKNIFAVAALGVITALNAPAFAAEKQENEDTFCLLFSATHQSLFGSKIAQIRYPEISEIREVEYTVGSYGSCTDFMKRYKAQDKVVVYEGASENIRDMRKGRDGTIQLFPR